MYFQKMANSHRRGNCIDKLRVGDAMKIQTIKREILKFYDLYTEHENWIPSPDFQGLESISEQEKVSPELAFTKNELPTVIKSCAPDNPPRPDEYTMAFYQKAWEFIKVDIMNALNHFHQQCPMIRWTNAPFIALVPKKKEATELRDYMPISCQHIPNCSQSSC